jgi:hypothetical protein
MYRRVLALSIVTTCLILVLATGVGVWGIQRGLLSAPIGIIRLGPVDVMAFAGVEYSTMRSPQAYYTVWVGLAEEFTPTPQPWRPWRPLVWARRLVRLRVPPPAVLMR